MGKSSALIILAGIALALGSCTNGGTGGSPQSPTGSPTKSSSAQIAPSEGETGSASQDPTSGMTSSSAEPSNSAPEPAPTTAALTLYFIAEGDGGVSGPAIGCGDSAVAVTSQPVSYTDPVEAALQTLFANHSQSYGQSGLNNALWQSQMSVSSIDRSGTQITAHLSGTLMMGGECDIPRVEQQILLTAEHAAGAPVAITLNGKTLSEALSLK